MIKLENVEQQLCHEQGWAAQTTGFPHVFFENKPCLLVPKQSIIHTNRSFHESNFVAIVSFSTYRGVHLSSQLILENAFNRSMSLDRMSTFDDNSCVPPSRLCVFAEMVSKASLSSALIRLFSYDCAEAVISLIRLFVILVRFSTTSLTPSSLSLLKSLRTNVQAYRRIDRH